MEFRRVRFRSDWAERDRSADDIQAELTARTAAVTGVYATAFQDSPLPAGSGGLPVQMVIRSADDFPQIYQTLEPIKGAAWGSGLFAFVDSDLAFDSPEPPITLARPQPAEMGVALSEAPHPQPIPDAQTY